MYLGESLVLCNEWVPFLGKILFLCDERGPFLGKILVWKFHSSTKRALSAWKKALSAGRGCAHSASPLDPPMQAVHFHPSKHVKIDHYCIIVITLTFEDVVRAEGLFLSSPLIMSSWGLSRKTDLAKSIYVTFLVAHIRMQRAQHSRCDYECFSKSSVNVGRGMGC
jgi:hypothetical protein